MSPKISIIVPVYNAVPYLDKCLDSLTRQTLNDIEIICIDNCSTDSSRKTIQQWADRDKRIHPVFNDTNIGQGASVNKAFDLTKGDYVAECDADDYASLDMYEKLYAASEGYIDVVKCGYIAFTNEKQEHNPVVDHWKYDCFSIKDLDEYETLSFIGRSVLLMPGIARRQFLIDNELRYRPEGVYEDTSLSFKIRTAAKTYRFLMEDLYYYRKDNPGSGTHTIKNVFGICDQFEEISRWNKKLDLHLDHMIAAKKFYTYRWNLNRLDQEQALMFLAKAREEFREDNTKLEYFNSLEDWNIYQKIRG